MTDTLFGRVDGPGSFAASYQFAKQMNREEPKKTKVAAYVRVSTLSAEQEHSFQNQTAYYSRYIRSNPDWQMVNIYSDHGKSGTMTTGRSGFNKMMKHAVEGKIDLILCKSISRFARNVLDTLENVRLLKEHGVRVIFDKENIDTDHMESEFILTTMAAVAEEESRSISENIKWSNIKRINQARVRYRPVLGYKKDPERVWAVDEETAAIVKEAFQLCLKGMDPPAIARHFISKGYTSVRGNSEWSSVGIRSILKNNIYLGEVFCKQAPPAPATLNQEQREPQSFQSLIPNHHEALIDAETFDRAQEILRARSIPKQKLKIKVYPLSKRLVCGCCGGHFHRFSQKGLVTWRCGKRIKSRKLCRMEGMKEDRILEAAKKGIKMYYGIDYEQHAFGKETRERMLKDIENIEMISDSELNDLRIELERLLMEERIALIKNQLEESKGFASQRRELEKVIQERESWWDTLSEDEAFRKEAAETLKGLSLLELYNKLNVDRFLRAWILSITIMTPDTFILHLVTGSNVTVDLKKGESEHG